MEKYLYSLTSAEIKSSYCIGKGVVLSFITNALKKALLNFPGMILRLEVSPLIMLL